MEILERHVRKALAGELRMFVRINGETTLIRRAIKRLYVNAKQVPNRGWRSVHLTCARIAQWRWHINYYRAAAVAYLLLALTRPPDSKAMIIPWTALRTVRSESA